MVPLYTILFEDGPIMLLKSSHAISSSSRLNLTAFFKILLTVTEESGVFFLVGEEEEEEAWWLLKNVANLFIQL